MHRGIDGGLFLATEGLFGGGGLAAVYRLPPRTVEETIFRIVATAHVGVEQRLLEVGWGVGADRRSEFGVAGLGERRRLAGTNSRVGQPLSDNICSLSMFCNPALLDDRWNGTKKYGPGQRGTGVPGAQPPHLHE
jgi:hypothetical protein